MKRKYFDLKSSSIKAYSISFVLIWITACDRDKPPLSTDRKNKQEQIRTKSSKSETDPDFIADVDQLRRLLKSEAEDGIRRTNVNSLEALKKIALSDPGLLIRIYVEDPAAMNFEGLAEIAGLLAENNKDFLIGWLENDLSESVDPDKRAAFASFLLPALAQVDLVAAFNSFDILSENVLHVPAEKESIWQNMLFRMGQFNAELAVSEATRRFGEPETASALSAIARGLAVKDVSGALEILSSIPDEKRRTQAVAQVLGSVGMRDFSQIENKISKMDSKALLTLLNDDRSQAFTTALFKNDLASVGRALESAVLSDQNRELFANYVSMKAEENPAAALDFAMSYPDSPLRDNFLLASIFVKWSKSDFDEALAKSQELDGGANKAAIRGLSVEAGSRGFNFVTEASKRMDPDSRGAFLAEALITASNADLDGGISYVTSNHFSADVNNEGQRNAIVEAVTRNYTKQNPADAFQWIETLDEKARVAAMGAYAKQFGSTDIQRLSEQLAGMKKDDFWRKGVSVLVNQLRNSDPAMAAQWEEALHQK